MLYSGFRLSAAVSALRFQEKVIPDACAAKGKANTVGQGDTHTAG